VAVVATAADAAATAAAAGNSMSRAAQPLWSWRARVVPGLAIAGLSLLTLGAGGGKDETVAEVVISGKGFRPATLNARKGEPLRVKLSTADHEHCFAIDELRVEKRVVPGRTTLLDITPDKPGRFAFYCCLENGAEAERGVLVVSE
jgi:heme/copper-type cytochrome/quinol oxidase subunit 2